MENSNNLVQVQFRSHYSKEKEYGGAAYTYIADVPLAVGDIVTVPTQKGEGEAKVCRVNVPESELPKWLKLENLKHITKPAVAGDAFAGFFG